MATRFEDLQIWVIARKLTSQVYAVSNGGSFVKDYGLKDQIRRASASIMANIAEGYERRSDREFLRFLDIAKGSCGEVRSHLYIALDAGYLSQEQFEYFRREYFGLMGMIASFSKSVSANANSLYEERAEYNDTTIQ